MKKTRVVGLAALLAIPVLAITACTSSGGRDSDAAPNTSGGGGKQLTIAVISHGPTGDTFFDILRKGAEAAAANDNAKLLWSSDADASKQSQLVQQAIDQKVDDVRFFFDDAVHQLVFPVPSHRESPTIHRVRTTDEAGRREYAVREDSYARELDAFLRAIAGDATNLTPPAQAARDIHDLRGLFLTQDAPARR